MYIYVARSCGANCETSLGDQRFGSHGLWQLLFKVNPTSQPRAVGATLLCARNKTVLKPVSGVANCVRRNSQLVLQPGLDT